MLKFQLSSIKTLYELRRGRSNCVWQTPGPVSPYIKRQGNNDVYSLFSSISVIPALSASNSILNFDNSWSNFRKCLSTCKFEQREIPVWNIIHFLVSCVFFPEKTDIVYIKLWYKHLYCKVLQQNRLVKSTGRTATTQVYIVSWQTDIQY